MNKLISFNRVDSSYDYLVENNLANVPTVMQSLYNMMTTLEIPVQYNASVSNSQNLLVGVCFMQHSYENDREHFNRVIDNIALTRRVLLVFNSWQVRQSIEWFRRVRHELDKRTERVLSRLFDASEAFVPVYFNHDVSAIESAYGYRVLPYNPCTFIDSSSYGTMTTHKDRKVVYGELDLNLASAFTSRFDIPTDEFVMFNFRNVIDERDLVENHYSRSWFVLMPSHIGDTAGMGFWRSKVQHAINVGSIIITDEHEAKHLGESFAYTYSQLVTKSDDELQRIAEEQRLEFEHNLSRRAALTQFKLTIKSIEL
ncbi:hypothetical protein VPHF86_0233 [Vibrio phage F86]